jgi:hypothetical protein
MSLEGLLLIAADDGSDEEEYLITDSATPFLYSKHSHFIHQVSLLALVHITLINSA